MIRISLGNVGSGKTASEVREIMLNINQRKTYTNIRIKNTKQKNTHILKPEFIIKKQLVKTIQRRGGDLEPVYKQELNVEYWQELKEPINVVLDEAHSIINSRRAMSKTNIVINDWLALIRRVLGQSEAGQGDLVLITQLWNRIDNIARDMAHQIRYHICHYMKKCKHCGLVWHENSEHPEPLFICPECSSISIKKYSHRIEIYKFAGMDAFINWKDYGMKTYYSRYIINDIETYFPNYNTLQWDNMFSQYY